MPQPEIRSIHDDHILVGERLRLTCVVRVSRGDVVSMNWDYTSDEVSTKFVFRRFWNFLISKNKSLGNVI